MTRNQVKGIRGGRAWVIQSVSGFSVSKQLLFYRINLGLISLDLAVRQKSFCSVSSCNFGYPRTNHQTPSVKMCLGSCY